MSAWMWPGTASSMNNSNPDMESRNVRIEDNLLDGVKYGGIFVIGAGNTIRPQPPAESGIPRIAGAITRRANRICSLAGSIWEKARNAPRRRTATGSRRTKSPAMEWTGAALAPRPALTRPGTPCGITGAGRRLSRLLHPTMHRLFGELARRVQRVLPVTDQRWTPFRVEAPRLCHIMRSCAKGSSTTLHSASICMVARVLVVYAGHSGAPFAAG